VNVEKLYSVGAFMKVRVISEHLGEGQFPAFEKGSKVSLKKACAHYLHWFACDIEGYQTYVPEIFVHEGILTRKYNPTELIQKTGDILEVQEIVYAWLIATNENGVTGWIPAEKVVSANDD
jgi:hypothetical protein